MDSNGFNNNGYYEQTNESYNRPTSDRGARFAEKIRAMFASGAFFAATIAYTVMAGASLSLNGGIDVFSVLFTIGMWLTYTSASKATPLSGMKFLSGVIKAYYIVAIVGIVGLVLSGVILLFTGPAVMNMGNKIVDVFRTIEENIGTEMYYILDGETVYFTVDELLNFITQTLKIKIATFFGIALVVLGVIFIIAAIVMILINELFVHKLSKQFKNAIDALMLGSFAELSLKGIRVWFIVIGVFASISTVSMLATFNIMMIASEGASAVACFAIASAIKGTEEVQNTAEPIL